MQKFVATVNSLIDPEQFDPSVKEMNVKDFMDVVIFMSPV